MLPAIAGALFGFAPLAMVLAPSASAQIQWPTLPNNLTEDVLQVANAISPPCAANNTFCQQLTTSVIPRCGRLRGDPGCWCGNHDPLHYCAICMSNPTDNQTTPDQTQAATAGHNAFHVACNAYEQLINGTATVSTTSAMSSSSAPTVSATAAASSSQNNKAPTTAIIGGVVGGVVALGIIGLIALWIHKHSQRDNGSRDIAPSSMSYMSSEAHKAPMALAAPYPHTSMNHYGSPGHVSPLPHIGYSNNPEPMNPGVPVGPNPQQGV